MRNTPRRTARARITIRVPRRSQLTSLRLMRGGRLVHVFDEPEPLPPNSATPQGEAEQ